MVRPSSTQEFLKSELPATNANRLSAPINIPSRAMSSPVRSAKKLFELSRGGRCMMRLSSLSAPSASAGMESVTRFIHRSCIGSSGAGMPNSVAAKTQSISPMLQPSR